MKLQKLLYMTHGYYLAETRTPWISEAFEAWTYGPVLGSVYREFREYRSNEIPDGRRMCVPVRGERGLVLVPETLATHGDPIGEDMVQQVLDMYGQRSALYLSSLTHKVGSPWDTVRGYTTANNAAIPNDLIRDYFANLLAPEAAPAPA